MPNQNSSDWNDLVGFSKSREDKKMKRIGNLWEKLISLENAVSAIENGTINKRTDQVVRRKLCYCDHDPKHLGQLDPIKVNLYAKKLIGILTSGWVHQAFRQKMITPPRSKKRNINCPTLTDHLIHWMIIQTIKPCIMRGMYDHTYGSIPGRGIDAARATVERWIQHDKSAKYFVKLDIRKFYDNINQELLFAAYQRIIKDKRVLDVLHTLIFATPSGVPIGAYPSQWNGNLYLQPLDHFIVQNLYKLRRGKRTNFVKHYLRYMDDMLLIGSSKRDLEKAVREVIRFCASELKIEIKSCWEIRQIAPAKVDSDGKKISMPHVSPVDICGYRFFKDHTEVRGSIFLHASRMATRIAKRLSEQNCIMLVEAEGLVSLCGWFSHADSEYFLKHHINERVNVNFLREVISYASKNGIVGDAARIYCSQDRRDGGYHILFGYSGGRARRRDSLLRDRMDGNIPLGFYVANKD